MIIILVFILLFLLLFSFDRLHGGEYPIGTTDKGESVAPSVSQIAWMNYSDKIKSLITRYCTEQCDELNNEISDVLIDSALNVMRSNAKYKFGDNSVTINKMNEMREVSDAHIDLVGILMNRNRLHFTRGIGVCEWHGASSEIVKSESNEFITIFDGKSISLTKSANITTELKLIKSLEGNSDIKIFLEFSYKNGLHAIDYYSYIHKFTIRIIPLLIMNVKRDIDNIFAVRINMNENRITKPIDLSNIIRNIKQYSTSNFVVNCYDECEFDKVVIPETKKEFSYDEEILLEIDKPNIKIEIQIEHSEGGKSHKSNFVEFIGRNISNKVNNENEIIDIFEKVTNYKFENGKFVCDKVPNNIYDKALVKSFAPYQYNLF